MHRKNIRALSLIVCTFTYLMIGAAVFDALETGEDARQRALLSKLEGKMQEKYNFSSKDYRVLKSVVIKSIPHKAGHQWKFAGAFYFATVVITMVGYGHSTPATFEGRIFCMFYALAGIPLSLVMFQSIGERLNTLISYLLMKSKKYAGIPSAEVSSTHLIMTSFSVGSMVVCIGSYVFHRMEGWNIFEAFYYCFITLTTIGFGDFVALQTSDRLGSEPGYVVFTLMFILFGLAIFSASVNLLVLKFMTQNKDPNSSDQEPQKRVVLETFSSGSNSLAEKTDTTPEQSGRITRKFTPAHKRQADAHTAAATLLNPVHRSGRTWICHGGCEQRQRKLPGWVKGTEQSKKRHHYYTVRRSPTRISHLLPGQETEEENSPQETDSFILHSIEKSRKMSF